jgi:predicted anti-sigma-YlaC factor YlaD
MSDPNRDHPGEEDLQAYLDGELTGAALAAVTDHLPSCARCTGRLDQLRGLFTLIESVPDLELGKDLAGEVLSALPFAPKRLRLLTGLQALAAVVLVLVGLPWLASSRLGDAAGLAVHSWTASWSGGLNQLLGELSALGDGLRQGLVSLTAPQNWPALPPIPASQLWLLAGCAALLWAVGNGTLLRRTEIGRRERR